jgi:FkbM family methyltransferase
MEFERRRVQSSPEARAGGARANRKGQAWLIRLPFQMRSLALSRRTGWSRTDMAALATLVTRLERRRFARCLKPAAHVRTTRLGSEYGGVHVPTQLLTDKSIVYSAGVGEDVTFDLALIEAVGCDVWAFDPTPRSIEFARSIHEPRFHFLPLGVWSEDSLQRFHAPADSADISHSIVNLQQTEEYFEAECRSVRSLMAELGHEQLDLLKLDIEGAEYKVLASLGNVRPRILCVEFHRVKPLPALLSFIRSLPYEPVRVDGWDATFTLKESPGHEEPIAVARSSLSDAVRRRPLERR